MISASQARLFAKKNFPNAPEELAKQLGVIVRDSPLEGCDGWCLTNGEKAIIRINRNLPKVRRRFTLAHELGHLILGIPAVVGETFEDMVRSDSAEETRVNNLASDLLLPTDRVKSLLPSPPVVARDLKKLATIAQVSELAAAIRVCNLAQEIGLVNATVVLFNGERIRWQWSTSLKIQNRAACRLLYEAKKVAPTAFRREKSDGNVIVASTIENPLFGTATLFVQQLPAELGMNLSPRERLHELEMRLFGNDARFRQQVNGYFGYFKSHLKARTTSKAAIDFWKHYGEKLRNTPLDSPNGRDYVELRLRELV
jgi:Zn-dependent peptidase ImmA (M78 family)